MNEELKKFLASDKKIEKLSRKELTDFMEASLTDTNRYYEFFMAFREELVKRIV